MAFSLCSPAGWDNDKKIAILYENMHSVKPDQYYTDVIARPIVVRKVSFRCCGPDFSGYPGS